MPRYIDVFLSPVRDNPAAQVALFALLAGIVLDVGVGLLAAIINNDVRSAKMRSGAGHKVGELGLACVADLVDGLLLGGAGVHASPVFMATVIYLAVMELFSICENCLRLSPDAARVPVIGTVIRVLDSFKGGE